jgi:hypothetical protein
MHDRDMCHSGPEVAPADADTREFIRYPRACPRQFDWHCQCFKVENLMNAPRVSTWLCASTGALALMGAMTACSLNPQPLPPETFDGGVSMASSDAGGASLGAADGAATPPIMTPDASSSAGDDGGASPTGTDASETSEASSEDAASAMTDASDASAADATDAAVDAPTDAPADVPTDAPAEAADGALPETD